MLGVFWKEFRILPGLRRLRSSRVTTGCRKHGLQWWKVSPSLSWCGLCSLLRKRKDTEAHAAKMRARPDAVQNLKRKAVAIERWRKQKLVPTS